MTAISTAEVYRSTVSKLKKAAIEDFAFETKLFLCAIMKIEPNQWFSALDKPWSRQQLQELDTMLVRREHGEPIQYILGTWDFMGLTFQVNPGALIPRPETETLCEVALHFAKSNRYQTVLDLCCGSGCIGISLSRLGKLQVYASDVSKECTDLTRQNAVRNNVIIKVIQSNLFSNITQKFDMIVSNPPYLTASDMLSLQTEVAFEPSLALYGGKDGLDFYRRIATEYQDYLLPNGILLLEVGQGQAHQVSELFSQPTKIFKDLSGNERVVAVFEDKPQNTEIEMEK